MRRRATEGGVTLLEVAVTVAVIFILATMGIIEYNSLDKRAHRNAKLTSVEALAKALRMYKFDYKMYPPLPFSDVSLLAPYTNVTALRSSFDSTATTPLQGVDIVNEGGSDITVYVRALVKGVNKSGANWGAPNSYNIKYYVEPASGNPAEGGVLVCQWVGVHGWQSCEGGL